MKDVSKFVHRKYPTYKTLYETIIDENNIKHVHKFVSPGNVIYLVNSEEDMLDKNVYFFIDSANYVNVVTLLTTRKIAASNCKTN